MDNSHPVLLTNEPGEEERLISTTENILTIKTFDDYGNVFNEWENLNIRHMEFEGI